MKLSISEIASLAGVSVRTLHYYDEIGLLKPDIVTSKTGYRYYNKESLDRLQQVLFFRELDFSLKDILQIMNSTEYNKENALRNQKKLLILKRDRMNRLIDLLDASLEGDDNMSFKEFEQKEIEEAKDKYKEEVKERWGSTKEYEESQHKIKNYDEGEWTTIISQANDIFRRFSEHIGEDPANKEVQNLVEEWKQYITKYYYKCSDEILEGLAEMYAADERFIENMDKYAKGTAQLMSNAIKVRHKL